MSSTSDLIEVSLSTLAISLVPLICLAYVSYDMGLQLESPIIVGIIRTFIQLSILGAILTPIFIWGTRYWEIVVAYALFMIVLASHEGASRTLYYFKGMSAAILASFLINICLISLFSFGIVIRPSPLWDPQYVIPIIGMLLGNCINGAALSINSLLSSFVEQSTEIELYLSFGATPREASARITQEAVRVGAMPQLNSMAVIGLISIPGMMTGQILGGSPVWEAARYQMLICYLIATVTFGTILVEIWISFQVAFVQERLVRSRFIRRPSKTTFLTQIMDSLRTVWRKNTSNRQPETFLNSSDRGTNGNGSNGTATERTPLVEGNGSVSRHGEGTSPEMFPRGSIQLISVSKSNSYTPNGRASQLELFQISRTINTASSSTEDSDHKVRRKLFHALSTRIERGEIVAVKGPSGIGKSQLLRLVGGLEPLDDDGGQVLLQGQSMSAFPTLTHWRRQVRYVSQHKIDIPGTPKQFISKVSSFSSWRRAQQSMPSFTDMLSATTKFIREWGLEATKLESEWKHLSGGESQRMYLAIAIASQPDVLLLDETTSALDLSSKTKVESTIERLANDQGISVLLITHDTEQVERMGHKK